MLLTCATWNYRHMLELLLASHQVSNPNKTLHVNAIDWPKKELAYAADAYPKAKFLDCVAPELSADKEMLGPVPRSAAILKLKVQLLQQHYANTTEPVIWVDADTLLLDSVDPMLNRVQAAGDFAVTYRKKKRKHAKFAVAVMCFTRSAAAEKLLSSYANHTAQSTGLVKRSSENGVAWFHDQLALWDAYQEHRRHWFGLRKANAPKLIALSDQEHSIDGSNTSAIFVSRRNGVLDVPDMQAVLHTRNMPVAPWPTEE